MAKTTVYTLQVVFNTMDFDCLSVYAFFLIVTVLLCGAANIEDDSFDRSFEISPARKVLKPPEDQFLGFINRLVKTGYTSSKIALNRIEKATKKRKEFGEQLSEFLANLPAYHTQKLIEQNQNQIA